MVWADRSADQNAGVEAVLGAIHDAIGRLVAAVAKAEARTELVIDEGAKTLAAVERELALAVEARVASVERTARVIYRAMTI